MFFEGQQVTIAYDDGQHLSRRTTANKAMVVKHIGCFVVLMVDGVGMRTSLDEYVHPAVTAESLAARFGATCVC